jgi:N-methylhydantoinase A
MAAGIVKVAVAKMVGSIREISIARGHDPRRYTLEAFGGAGPMHAAAVAEELHMNKVMMPAFAGNFSALGLLTSDIRHDFAETMLAVNRPDAMPAVAASVAKLKQQALARFTDEGVEADAVAFAPSAEMRYLGQAFEIAIPLTGDTMAGDLPDARKLLETFHRIYESYYGHANEDQEAEIVNVRLSATVRTSKPRIENPTGAGEALIERRSVYFDREIEDVPVYDRDLLARGERLAGPAIIEELSSTTVVPPGWSFERDAFDNLCLERMS